MQSRLYFRRWTRMNFQPALELFSKYGVLTSNHNYQLELKPPQPPLTFIKTPNQNRDRDLIADLLAKYPQLKYEPIARAKAVAEDKSPTSFSYIFNFVELQKRLMYKGLSKQAAFKQAEEVFQARINRKLEQTLVSQGLAFGNQARSFMSMYQQQLQYESRLKTLRTQREVKKYSRKLEQVDRIQKGQVRDEVDVESETYEKMFYKVVDEKGQNVDIQSREEMVSNFERRSSALFQHFYSKASCMDQLDALADSELINNLLRNPNRIKAETRKLLIKLEKHGVRLDENGRVDYSQCTNQKVRKVFESNRDVRIALLEKDLLFESAEREHRLVERLELEERLSQKKAEKSKLQGRKEEESKDRDEDDIVIEKKYSNILTNELMGKSYAVFESKEERELRLEVKWLAKRAVLLKADNDSERSKHYLELANKTLEQLRRLKYRVDQIRENSAALMFEEHGYMSPEDLALDQYSGYEKLTRYLRQPSENRRLTFLDQDSDNKINSAIDRVQIEQSPRPEGYSAAYAPAEPSTLGLQLSPEEFVRSPTEVARHPKVRKAFDRFESQKSKLQRQASQSFTMRFQTSLQTEKVKQVEKRVKKQFAKSKNSEKKARKQDKKGKKGK